MSSFTRTIERTQAHKVARSHKERGVYALTVEGRDTHFMGRGSKLGISNPKDPCMLARKRREEHRRQQQAGGR